MAGVVSLLTAIAAAILVLLPSTDARAQNVNAFKVMGAVNAFTFNVK